MRKEHVNGIVRVITLFCATYLVVQGWWGFGAAVLFVGFASTED